MAAGLATGLSNKAYLNTGSYGSPTWTLLTFVRDVMLKVDRDFASVKARISEWEMFLPTFKKLDIDLEILGDTSIAYYDTLRDAQINGTMKEFAFCDQAIASSGARYLRAEMYVKTWPVEQKLEDANTVKAALVLAYHASHVPTWVNV